ncbi:MAG: release factor H-coupled RctB family protein [Kiritimatiellia bacterium]|jgi:release factor H-coupled RctB family protein
MTHRPPNSELPDHARVLTAPGLWLEGSAITQLGAIAREAGCVRAVGLPDLHTGPGIPIGAAFAFRGVFRPHLVGGDAGCGVRVVAVSRVRARGDNLERRVREMIVGDALPDAHAGELLRAVWSRGPQGLLDVDGVPASLMSLAAAEPAGDVAGACPDLPELGDSVGTIGGGNHFLEASRVANVVDKVYARSLGLKTGGFAVVAHSGSRGLGGWLSRRYGTRTLDPQQRDVYLGELAGAVNFAKTNRLVLAWRMLLALGAARSSRITGMFDVTHNTVVKQSVDGADAWVFRKGSAPADVDQPTIVLGSRGTPSWVMRGCGNTDCLCSVAHGAGRKMGRSEAVAKLKTRYRRSELTRTPLGGRVICDDNQLLYAEHPDAYKDVEVVVQALEDNMAATRVASLEPLVTVKR